LTTSTFCPIARWLASARDGTERREGKPADSGAVPDASTSAVSPEIPGAYSHRGWAKKGTGQQSRHCTGGGETGSMAVGCLGIVPGAVPVKRPQTQQRTITSLSVRNCASRPNPDPG